MPFEAHSSGFQKSRPQSEVVPKDTRKEPPKALHGQREAEVTMVPIANAGSTSRRPFVRPEDRPIPRLTTRPSRPSTTVSNTRQPSMYPQVTRYPLSTAFTLLNTNIISAGLVYHLYGLYMRPRTTLNLIWFWNQYFSSMLPAQYNFNINQWHSDPGFNTANRRYIVNIGLRGSDQLLLTGVIYQPQGLRPRTAHDLVAPISLAELGLPLPEGNTLFFVADTSFKLFFYNEYRYDVRTVALFDDPITEFLAIKQELLWYLADLERISERRSRSFRALGPLLGFDVITQA